MTGKRQRVDQDVTHFTPKDVATDFQIWAQGDARLTQPIGQARFCGRLLLNVAHSQKCSRAKSRAR